jgi:hypothetical protein
MLANVDNTPLVPLPTICWQHILLIHPFGYFFIKVRVVSMNIAFSGKSSYYQIEAGLNLCPK